MNRIIALFMLCGVCCAGDRAAIAAEPAQDEEHAEPLDKYSGYQSLVAETHQRSLAGRERESREVVAKDSFWVPGEWGDTIWSLAALYMNKKVDEANARLLKHAKAYLFERAKEGQSEPNSSGGAPFEPGKADTPWAYFGLGDYVRILCLFHANSPHFPGRLNPQTEAAMKEALWHWAKTASRIEDASLDQLLVLQGTENHDLTKRPNYYLIASVLKDDSQYKNRHYDDGHTVQQHFEAWSAYFREWPRKRAMTGMWTEVGSDTYQKYSWPALFNLHDLAPDAVLRKRFAMLLDLAFIEEAQISLKGRRGGGRSRAGYGHNSFEYYKNLLYAPEGVPARASHSKIIETSRYQLPAAAILLRYVEFPTERPFVIANRVLGELAPPRSPEDQRHRLVEDAALVNYAWRTRHYLLGCTLQDPSLAYPDPETGEPVLRYSGISRQNRWGGMLLHDPNGEHAMDVENDYRPDNEICAIYPVVEKTRGGRPQHPYWSFQHRNVLLLQRIGQQPSGVGSYSTGRISVRFHGKSLHKIEEGGWIFASNGKAFAGVRFLDHQWQWDGTREEAVPVGCEDPQCTARILIHSGDMHTDGSFEDFLNAVVKNPPTVDPEKVEYRAGRGRTLIEFFRYDVNDAASFRLPRAGGASVNLRPQWTYQSPYLKGRFQSDRITVTVGPVEQVYDFGKSTVFTHESR